MDVSIERLEQLFTEYRETLSAGDTEEWFISTQEIADLCIPPFLVWLKERLSTMTAQQLMDKHQSGLRVEAVRLGSTMGFFVAEKHLQARAIGKAGKVMQWVPGHGGDVWAVYHDDGSVGVYMYDELHELKSEEVSV